MAASILSAAGVLQPSPHRLHPMSGSSGLPSVAAASYKDLNSCLKSSSPSSCYGAEHRRKHLRKHLKAVRASSSSPRSLQQSDQGEGPGTSGSSGSSGSFSSRLGLGQAAAAEPGAAASPKAKAALLRALEYKKKKAEGEASSSLAVKREGEGHVDEGSDRLGDGSMEALAERAAKGMEKSQVFKQQQSEMMSALSASKAGREERQETTSQRREVAASAAAAASPTADAEAKGKGPDSKTLNPEQEEPSGSKGESTRGPAVTEPKRASGLVEIEIVTRDGVVRRSLPQNEMAWAKLKETKRSGVSQTDFLGLGFSDKKPGGGGKGPLPAGLAAPMDAPRGALPEVQIITRDAGGAAEGQGEGDDAYRPKVATWGVFPRPRDISSKYGGGRTIQPGQALETPEQKAAREERTRKLLEEYNLKAGLKIDPAVKAECEKAFSEGNELMDKGKLQAAIEKFDVALSKLNFKTDLYGQAAMQKAVCLDSQARSEQARAMYERLSGHPNMSVQRKARQMLFGFQAAENLRIQGKSDWDPSYYRQYFDSVSGKYNTMYRAQEEENEGFAFEALVGSFVILFPLVLFLGLVALRQSG